MNNVVHVRFSTVVFYGNFKTLELSLFTSLVFFVILQKAHFVRRKMSRRRAAGALSEPLLAAEAAAPAPASNSAASSTFSLALNSAQPVSSVAGVDNTELVSTDSFGGPVSQPETPRAVTNSSPKESPDTDATEAAATLVSSSSGTGASDEDEVNDVVDDAFFKCTSHSSAPPLLSLAPIPTSLTRLLSPQPSTWRSSTLGGPPQ